MTASASLRRAARDVHDFAETQPLAGARIVDEQVTARLRADTGDGSMSNARRLGRATTRVTSSGTSASVRADGGRAIWTWLEEGTSAHAIKAKGHGRRAKLRTPYGPRAAVHVRGMRAKRTWTEANRRAVPLVERDAQARFTRLGG